jgi:formyl-CoA transferase/CoA:oxalate CoA-transferase
MADSRPLKGVKVIDFTRYLAGPFCTQILGDYGAEVLKIEPVEGARAELGGYSGKDSYFFMSTNRSKKSVQISTKSSAGRAVLAKMLDSADVVVDNFRPGVMDALGFSHEVLAKRNPRIIACSVTGFGPTGPLRNNPGFDQIAQGFSGVMSVTGTAESGPTRVGIAICDLLGGIFAAQGILLALEARHRTGRGQKVETSLIEAIVSVLSWSAGIYFDTGKTPAPAGNHHPLSAPHGVFHAADRPFNIAVGNDAMWRSFVNVIDRPDLADNPAFDSAGHRLKHRDELTEQINAALKLHPAEYWIDLFNRSGIPAGPILTVGEMFNHPQTLAREMLLTLPHPVHGLFRTTGLGVKLAATPGAVARPPLLGEHTAEVLEGYGYTPADFTRLRAEGAIK